MVAAIPFPMIDPVAVSFGPIVIRWYALAYIAGILLGWFYAIRLTRNDAIWGGPSPVSRAQLDDFVLWLTFGVILGGRLGYVLFYNPGHYLSHPAEIIRVWEGGMAFHGGLLGVLVAIVWFARRNGIPPLSLADIVTASVTFGLFFGRIANFVNAELWGRVTDLPWAVVFPGAGPQGRHPSQLYEATLEGVALFVILRILTHRYGALRKPGVVTGTFVAGYGFFRFLIEFVREPDVHIGFLPGGLTMGMVLSLPMIAIGGALALWAWRR